MSEYNAHRTLRVLRTRMVTPKMARVTLGGDELAGYPAFGPDQRIKLFFPVAGQDRPAMPRASSGGPIWPPGEPRPVIRSYTVRRHDAEAGELDVDFVLHTAAGPAAEWALRAQPGDWVGISEPGGRYQPDLTVDHHLVIGDESALPAICTVLSALGSFGGPITVFVEVADAAEEQSLPLTAQTRAHWLHRADAPPGRPLTDAVTSATLPEGTCQAWLSAESTAVRDIRAHLLDERAVPRRMIYATGYWRARPPR
ncbi:siderophore-interacting protein [Pseudonocardia eucalypti]|uniref:Siderophore-interacting protein n=1 Tax=Pseudonocardia eucalypti TaxID=648755 RepID=A0ABP9Q6H5_9PSEU|nr:NADPH-dependent ferric siderophore reductase [Pseudonocardia eucalypti]